MAEALEKAEFSGLNPLRLSAELRRLTALQLHLETQSAERADLVRRLGLAEGKLTALRKELLRFHVIASRLSEDPDVVELCGSLRDVALRFWPDLRPPKFRKL